MTESSESTRVLASTYARRATLEDLDWLIGELRQFSEVSNTKYPMFEDEDYVRETLIGMIEREYVSIAERDGERLGFVGAYYRRHPFNPKIRVLGEMFWWVTKAHRGSRAAAVLMDEYLAWGRLNAEWITFGLQTHTQMNEASLLKKGFLRRECNYLIEVT